MRFERGIKEFKGIKIMYSERIGTDIYMLQWAACAKRF
jgi:hypothetical protein